ncbi:MAG: CBS domain-containing protein [Firmicutes bacterium]|nr:CBS domain-containing protein [Bacillota bacterium]
MLLARDIMTAPTISINQGKTVKVALDLLAEHNISGLPVVDDDENVVGVISGSDIMRYSQNKKVLPSSSTSFWVSPYSETDDIATIRNGFEALHRTIIKDVMTKKVYTANFDTPISEVAQLMIKRKINRVPVVTDDKKLAGIISRADLVKFMAETEN